jgi:hypothetical protein
MKGIVASLVTSALLAGTVLAAGPAAGTAAETAPAKTVATQSEQKVTAAKKPTASHRRHFRRATAKGPAVQAEPTPSPK